ncbi:Alpha/Beta hydrolase protein [Neurospora hispaniola]|uniref:Alpha/Beta hydrolase protein n=1 Tax=Neurospora hispaniola TaxID=588809 RepID=A0AAJ0I581_9PEZI|nr:Alpha/Beta hydrolase protein [Neurospora hispaniola]
MSFLNLNLNLTYQNIHFRHPSSSSSLPIPLPPLPPGISRSFIPTPHGDLEILHTTTTSSSRQSALFFIHGGMGSASVWLEYLSFFSQQQQQNIPCYAISMRGHGGSWYPSYLRMVYGTTKGDLTGDVVSGIRWAVDRERGQRKQQQLGRGVIKGQQGRQGKEGRGGEKGDDVEAKEEVEMVLIGHSSGGGLAQYILSAGLLGGLSVKIKGLVLMGAVPGFGSIPIYLTWFRLDPLFALRLLLHLGHPNSPLSHPSLVRLIFFSNDLLPDSYLSRFMSFMSRYESLLWPLGMARSFADSERVLLRICGWGETTKQEQKQGQVERVLVIAGERDKIMTQPIVQRLADWYRAAYERLVVEEKKIDGVMVGSENETVDEEVEGSGGPKDTAGRGVRFALVPGAGHHCQNDVGWEVGARKVLAFYRQLL